MNVVAVVMGKKSVEKISCFVFVMDLSCCNAHNFSCVITHICTIRVGANSIAVSARAYGPVQCVLYHSGQGECHVMYGGAML